MIETENIKKLKLPTATTDDISKSRILIVDDEDLVRGFLSNALIDKGYEVEVAEECNQALEILSTKSFDLILSDINLPGMSGDELLQVCKKKYKSTEIMLITGAPGLAGAVQAVKNGAYDYLSKPISPEKLFERVKSALLYSKSKPLAPINTGSTLPDTGYSVVRTLGSGNMGVVLLVEKNKQYYAMKILRRESPGSISDRQTQRFAREAEILSQIDHPNVVKIFEFGISEDDEVPFFVMEFVPGRPLNYHIMNNTLSLDEKISIIRQVSDALDFVHGYGVLHRDIKPSNILITDKNIIKLTDFGIARAADSNLTITREVLGSPAYMSPEAFDSSRKKDQRSDIFSLGIIAYELLTGVKPFRGESIGEIMEEIKSQKPIEPIKILPSLPGYLQDILAKMLAKQPEDRFNSAGEILQALDHKDGNTPKNQGITARLLRTLILRNPTWS